MENPEKFKQETSSVNNEKDARCSFLHSWVPARVSVGFLVASGVMMLYMLRVNLSVAIVAMAYTPTASSTQGTFEETKAYCQEINTTATSLQNVTIKLDDNTLNSTLLLESEDQSDHTDQLLLNGAQKGIVLGAFFYGYVFTNIPGGRLAELYGTKIVFGGSILMSGLLTLFTPLAARSNYLVLAIVRTLIGIAQGVSYPSMHVLVARWIPPLERPRFISITYMANCLGTILTLPLCGVIIDSMGWPPVFYISGGVSLIWVIFWTFLMYDSPSDHPRISEKERIFILSAIGEGTSQQKPSKTPWCVLLTSLPLWAINMAHIGGMFGFTLLLTHLPTYMNSVLGFSIKNNGLLSSLPFLAQFLGSSSCGLIGDWLLTRNYITASTSRRIFATVALLGPAITLIAVGYVGCNITLAVALFPIGAGFLGGMGAGHMANHLDLSPNFAGTLLGISNTIAFAVSMCAPIMVGAITTEQTLEQWRLVFWLTGGLFMICWLFYILFSKFEIQPWNYYSDDANVDDMKEDDTFFSKSVGAESQKKNGTAEEKV